MADRALSKDEFALIVGGRGCRRIELAPGQGMKVFPRRAVELLGAARLLQTDSDIRTLCHEQGVDFLTSQGEA